MFFVLHCVQYEYARSDLPNRKCTETRILNFKRNPPATAGARGGGVPGSNLPFIFECSTAGTVSWLACWNSGEELVHSLSGASGDDGVRCLHAQGERFARHQHHAASVSPPSISRDVSRTATSIWGHKEIKLARFCKA